MNLLFYYDNYCGPDSRGGTEVATARIATALRSTGGYRVFNAFRRGTPPAGPSVYDGIIHLRRTSFASDLAAFIRENEIDAVVNMGRFFRHSILRKAIAASGRDVRLIFMHHFAPGSETVKGTWKSGLHLLRLDPLNPLYWLRVSFYPLLKLPRRLNYRKIYRKVYDWSDAVVLLSDGYKADYCRVAGISSMEKFHAIPNIFEAPDLPDATRKEPRVLLLSRMDEIQKRISLALKVWKIIEARPELSSWHLDIVGHGHDARGLKRLARRLGLQRVTFHGWSSSRPFLEKDSILMSTSLYEGLSLAMIEALTYGCVPVAFDSYASLRDIVEDGATGLAISPFGDIEGFADSLASLMADPGTLGAMQTRGREGVDRFSPQAVANSWHSLLLFLRN